MMSRTTGLTKSWISVTMSQCVCLCCYIDVEMSKNHNGIVSLCHNDDVTIMSVHLTVCGGGWPCVGLGSVVTPMRGGGAAQTVQNLTPVTQPGY